MTFLKIKFSIVLSHFLMLGVFYAYTREYKHDNGFLRTKQTFKICTKIKLHKTSKCLRPLFIDVCCEMNGFFSMFLKSLSENP